MAAAAVKATGTGRGARRVEDVAGHAEAEAVAARRVQVPVSLGRA